MELLVAVLVLISVLAASGMIHKSDPWFAPLQFLDNDGYPLKFGRIVITKSDTCLNRVIQLDANGAIPETEMLFYEGGETFTLYRKDSDEAIFAVTNPIEVIK